MPGTTAFPGALDSFPAITATTQEDAAGVEHDVVHENVHACMLALEAKVGVDGSLVVTSLEYRVTTAYNLAAAAIPASAAGVANGVATLDSGGKVPSSQLPAGTSATWGAITGTLNAQTDLQSALDAKLDDSQLDTDGTLAADSDTRIASQKAVKTYVDTKVTGVLTFKGSTDCSANPNYPAASKGDSYVVSVAGKIGGASGIAVDIGDLFAASANNAGGTQASVGTSWFILEHNLVGALLAANNLSDVASASTARTNLGLGTVATLASDTDGTLAADSDSNVATQKAVKTYVATELAGIGGVSGGGLTLLQTATVTGSAASSLAFAAAVDLATDKAYLIELVLGNATASDSNISLFFNSDTTATNYYRHSMGAQSGSISGAEVNSGQVCTLAASETFTGNGWIMPDFNGRPRAKIEGIRASTSNIAGSIFFMYRNNIANVTSIQISASVANSLSVGSVMRLYKFA